MIYRERLAERVFLFQSEVYAEVNAGVVAGPDFAVVIDTLALPQETRMMREFIVQELRVPVRYVVLTHYHADHSWGAYFFPGATVLGHAACRRLLQTRGQEALEKIRETEPMFARVKLVPPQLTITQGEMLVRVGEYTLRLFPLPGHSEDGLGVYIEEKRILFAGDVFMPLPVFVDGDVDDMVRSLKRIAKMPLDILVPGHGPVVLRGEVQEAIQENLKYISCVRKYVRYSARRRYPGDYLAKITLERCGKNPALLAGTAAFLHRRNIWAFFERRFGRPPERSEEAEASEGLDAP